MIFQRALTTAEDGETMGTLAQFAGHLNVLPTPLLRCAERHDRAIVLSSRENGPVVLILDADTLNQLPDCARSQQT